MGQGKRDTGADRYWSLRMIDSARSVGGDISIKAYKFSEGFNAALAIQSFDTLRWVHLSVCCRKTSLAFLFLTLISLRFITCFLHLPSIQPCRTSSHSSYTPHSPAHPNQKPCSSHRSNGFPLLSSSLNPHDLSPQPFLGDLDSLFPPTSKHDAHLPPIIPLYHSRFTQHPLPGS